MKVALLVACLAASAGVEAAENLALGKSYRFSLPANYSLSTDDGDETQLTDGKLAPSDDMLWTKKESVGWYVGKGDSVVMVTVDLGETMALGGFSWHYAAGAGGVAWPSTIFIYVSADGKTWDCVGDLLENSVRRDGGPQVDRYRDYRAWSSEMPAKGRYVMFAVKSENYIFCDELEVFAGDEHAASAAHEAAFRVSSPADHVQSFQVRERVMTDLRRLGGEEDRNLRAAVDGLVRQDSRDTRTVLPLNAVHARVWALNARKLASAGHDRPVFWRNCRWDNLDPLAVPDKRQVRPLEIEMMRGEVRAETINVLNPTESERTCVLEVSGLPDAANVRCHEVVFTDTRDKVATAAVLMPGKGRRLEFRLPAGASQQVWISFDRPTAAAGTYEGLVRAEVEGADSLTCPVRLRLSRIDYPADRRLHVYGWDYTADGNCCPRTEAFLKSHLQMMREIGVDIPWEVFGYACPQNARFAENGALENAKELDFKNLDGWLDMFPDAFRYAIFVGAEAAKNNAGDFVFFGEKVGTPRFDRMAGDYFRAIADRMMERGRREGQLMLCFVDEPGEWKADWQRLGDLVNSWSTAVRAKCPDVVFFQDPTYNNLSAAPKAYWETSDIYCPGAVEISKAGEFRDFYANLRKTGKTLFTYSCEGPSRTMDPVAYYRGIAYVAFRNGAKGIGFWAFGHSPGKGCDSWHAYSQTGIEFSPYFVSHEGVVATKQSEGIREGVEDYAYLSLLADKIHDGLVTGQNVSAMKTLIRDGVNGVLEGCRAKSWMVSKDRTAMDDLRVRVLRALEE